MTDSPSPFTFSTSMDASAAIDTPKGPLTPTTEREADDFGDEATATPRSGHLPPSTEEQLRRRHLNARGLPEDMYDHSHHNQANKHQASGVRTRSRRGEKDTDTGSGSGLSMGERMRERLKSPLLGHSGFQLEELRENFSKNVEVKYVLRS